jgi:hypothetical protein
LAGTSSTCEIPKVHSILHSYRVSNTSLPGIRDKLSATTFSLPLICKISKLNYDRKSNQRAFRLDTVAVVYKYVSAAWSVNKTKCWPTKKWRQRSKASLIATNSRSVAL